MQKEKFKELYDYCQTLSPKVKRNSVIDKIKELTNQKVRCVKTTLDTEIVRGYFLSAANTEHSLVREHGFNVIVLARGLNDCWERFVNVKEAMHLLDSAEELTDTKDKFEQLLIDWVQSVGSREEQQVSDIRAIWMTLACLCPEHSRLEFEAKWHKGQIDDFGVALALSIPKLYVQLLFRPTYPLIIANLFAE
ncbi:hypothetical protein [Comamonas sp. JNW]|uniref:hypothetical protein n=1 Tax=Comamonas sp. JNW TaxID=2170731 RepID=UPI001057DF02|nr:hypothetical protein [Comamonas sp. JNW]